MTDRTPYTWDAQQAIPIEAELPVASDVIPNDLRAVPAPGAWIVSFVQQEYWLPFVSIIQLGASILYRDNPEYAQQILEAWYAMTEYPRPALCDDFLPCLLTSEGLDTLVEALATEILKDTIANIVEGKFPSLEKGLGPGLPPAETILTEPLGLGANPSCNKDILWSQCLAVVTTLSTALLDFMDNIEVSTNVVELGEALVSAVPVLGALAETVGASGWVEVASYFQSAFEEGFVAGYTETPGGTRDSLACELFCACQDDCVITIDRIFYATAALFDESVPDSALESLQAAAEFISGVSLFSAESSYYATMFFAMLMGKAGSAFFPAVTQGTLNLILALAADEPSNDWELLCDCSVPTKTNIPAYGRGYTIGSGTTVIVNPVTDGQYVIPSVPIGETVTLINNGGATAIGDCASSYPLVVEIVYVDGYSSRRVYGAGSCSEVATNYSVGEVFTDKQVNGFGAGATGFKILA